VAGWVAANLSWSLITGAIELAGALATTIAGNGLSPGQILTRLLVVSVVGGPVFLILLNLVLTVMTLAVVMGLIVTGTLLLILTICAPLALCLLALPYTEALAWLWWRALVAALSIPILDALIVALISRILLQPGGLGVLGLRSW